MRQLCACSKSKVVLEEIEEGNKQKFAEARMFENEMELEAKSTHPVT